MMKAITVGLLSAVTATFFAFAAPTAHAMNFFDRMMGYHQCFFFGCPAPDNTTVNSNNTYTDSFNTATSNTTNTTYTGGSTTGTGTGSGSGSYNYSSNRAPVWDYVGDRTVYTGQTLTISLHATDPENDFLYYDAIGLPSGAYFDRTFHTLYWVPSEDQTGNHSIQFSVTDNHSTVYQTVNVVVISSRASNRAPVWNTVGDKNVDIGQSLQFSVSATDPDGDSITYSALNLPSGANFNSANRTFSWVPVQGQSGSYVVSFRASDGNATSDMGVRIQVGSSGNTSIPSGNNHAPQFFGFNPGTSATVNQLYLYDVNATDPDGDALTYSLISAPSGMSINAGTGFIAWVPTQTGTNAVRVAVSDGINQTTADFTVTVYANGTPAPTPAPVAGNPAPTEAKLVISDIRIESKNDEIVVSWKTNIPAGSRVIYDTTSEADRTRNFSYANATKDDAERFTNHEVNLGKLEKNLVFYLRVVSKTDLQTAVGQEIGFIQLENGQVQSFFGASLINIFGKLFSNTAFLWTMIAGLGTAATVFYRKHKKASMTL